MQKNILVAGTIAYDFIMDFPDKFGNHIFPDKIHMLSVSFVTDRLEKQYGGTAGNIAYTIKLLGQNPIIFSVAGKDFGTYKKWLETHNISTKYVTINKNDFTASAHIITDQDDNQITAFHGGPMFKNNTNPDEVLSKENISYGIAAPTAKRPMMNAIRGFMRHNIPFIFDPGQNVQLLDKKDIREAIDGCMMMIVNDYELELVKKISGYTEKKIIESMQYLIVTIGKKGSIIYSGKKKINIPIAKAQSGLDPTGAGDAFRAGILTGLQKGYDIETSAKIAATASAYTVERYGTQTHTFSKKAFEKRFHENFKEKISL